MSNKSKPGNVRAFRVDCVENVVTQVVWTTSGPKAKFRAWHSATIAGYYLIKIGDFRVHRAPEYDKKPEHLREDHAYELSYIKTLF